MEFDDCVNKPSYLPDGAIMKGASEPLEATVETVPDLICRNKFIYP